MLKPEIERGDTFVGFRPVIFDTKKSNRKKDRRNSKKELRELRITKLSDIE